MVDAQHDNWLSPELSPVHDALTGLAATGPHILQRRSRRVKSATRSILRCIDFGHRPGRGSSSCLPGGKTKKAVQTSDDNDDNNNNANANDTW
jgi:hypothetical protein